MYRSRAVTSHPTGLTFRVRVLLTCWLSLNFSFIFINESMLRFDDMKHCKIHIIFKIPEKNESKSRDNYFQGGLKILQVIVHDLMIIIIYLRQTSPFVQKVKRFERVPPGQQARMRTERAPAASSLKASPRQNAVRGNTINWHSIPTKKPSG